MNWMLDAAVEKLVQMALVEDLGGRGDITSQATIPVEKKIRGRVTAKASGVIAGLPVFETVYKRLDSTLDVCFHVQDSQRVEPGTVVCDVTGSARAVLTGERAALNFLQRLSGVATLTARYVEAVSGTKAVILDTRKTTPGWRLLEKYAVSMGGGQNHRMGLYDMVLVKDNHIEAAGGITAAVNAVRQCVEAAGLPIVVEVEDLSELYEALAQRVDRILLDNMPIDMIKASVAVVGGRVPLEASGNMTLERVGAVAAAGVDYISVGALTHSAPALDLSMRLSELADE